MLDIQIRTEKQEQTKTIKEIKDTLNRRFWAQKRV